MPTKFCFFHYVGACRERGNTNEGKYQQTQGRASTKEQGTQKKKKTPHTIETVHINVINQSRDRMSFSHHHLAFRKLHMSDQTGAEGVNHSTKHFHLEKKKTLKILQNEIINISPAQKSKILSFHEQIAAIPHSPQSYYSPKASRAHTYMKPQSPLFVSTL